MFKQDLLRGQKAEYEFAKLLIELGYAVEFNKSNTVEELKL